jgi:hypothetical protein
MQLPCYRRVIRVTISRMRRKILGVLMATLACGGEEAKEPATDQHAQADAGRPLVLTRQYANEGAVCMSPVTVDDLRIQVVLDECASYCSEVDASCTASLQGDTIQLIGQGQSVVPDARLDCPAACLVVEARCTLEDVPPGAYTLRYGSRTHPIVLPVPAPQTEVLPGSGQAPCSLRP